MNGWVLGWGLVLQCGVLINVYLFLMFIYYLLFIVYCNVWVDGEGMRSAYMLLLTIYVHVMVLRLLIMAVGSGQNPSMFFKTILVTVWTIVVALLMISPNLDPCRLLSICYHG